MLPLYEAKMIHHYDHRWATYDESGDVRDVTEAEHADPHFVVMPRYWVASDVVRSKLDGRWDHEWLVGFRDICRSTDERTMITGVFPAVAVGNKLPLLLPTTGDARALSAVLSSVVTDYVVRQKLGGTTMNFFYVEQLPVLHPSTFSNVCVWASGQRTLGEWIADRTIELTCTAQDMAPASQDVSAIEPPFVWDKDRRDVLRAELDSAFFLLYGIDRDDAEYILSTFPIANRKDPALAQRVLEAYDRIAESVSTGKPFNSDLNPPPGQGRRHERVSR